MSNKFKRHLNDNINQRNTKNHAFWDKLDNHSNQCNPNNDEYWHCREKDEEDK